MQVRRRDLSNFQEKRQQSNDNFIKKLITKANEHSKKLTIVDTIIYFVLTILSLATMIIWPQLAEYCVAAISCVATTFVAVRLGYSAKSAIENFKKISAEMKLKEKEIPIEENTDEDEETLG